MGGQTPPLEQPSVDAPSLLSYEIADAGMNRTHDPIDEYTLAAFMAGTLSADRRREVIAYLVDHPDARELLRLAGEALETARSGAPVPAGRPAERRGRLRTGAMARFVAAAVLVFSVGLGLRVAFGPSADVLRTPARTDAQFTVQVYPTTLAFRWSPVPDAYRYRIVVWDPAAAAVVAQHETTAHELTQDDPFVRTLVAQLVARRAYTVRVDAIDAQNRLVRSSEPVVFTPGP